MKEIQKLYLLFIFLLAAILSWFIGRRGYDAYYSQYGKLRMK